MSPAPLTLNALISVCLLCWSTWGIFDKKALEAARHIDVLIFQHLFYVLEVPLIFLLLGYLYPQGWSISPPVWAWTLLGSGVSSLAMLFYLVAMSRAEASFVLGITAAYPLVVQIFALFLLHEALVAERVLGSLLIGLGVAFIGSSAAEKSEEKEKALPENGSRSSESSEESEQEIPLVSVPPVSLLRQERLARVEAGRKRKNKTQVLALCCLATLAWGMTGLFDKKALLIDAPFKVYFARCAWDAVILAVMLAGAYLMKQKIQWRAARAWKYSLFSSLCLSLGTIAYMFAMTMASASYIIVITGCYPLFMYLFAILFLKEKLRKARLIGVLLVVGGGLLVQETQGV
ncbi:MAG: DMT family transporter [Candidatus Melainabacteria bacterium]|nr:DMT family transporter [Candidatus Melainabacteria bacterium]